MIATTEGIYGPQNPFRDESAVPSGKKQAYECMVSVTSC